MAANGHPSSLRRVPWRRPSLQKPVGRRLHLGVSIAVAMGLGGFLSLFLLFSVVGTPASATVAVVVILGVIGARPSNK
jgi:hypothetical protein